MTTSPLCESAKSVKLCPVIGQRFGNYQAVSLIGEGGMGEVYLAEHPSIGRQVAIKVLRSELGHDANALARFVNEARAANSIRHPNIIEILDSGVTENGISYLVMELLQGESLTSRIRRRGRLSSQEAVILANQTASALGAAHAKGIVHRDLKPDNLFVVPEPTNPGLEHIKVLDFGIAKLQTNVNPQHVKTRTGSLMGTPVYMSPEQCLGTKEVDWRSDIYSLGAIMYEMLTGQPPFVSEGFGALLNMHLNQAPLPPRQIEPSVSPGLDDAVLKMLAKKPEDRFQSMAEVQSCLAAAVGMTPAPFALSNSVLNSAQALGATINAPVMTVPTPTGKTLPVPTAPGEIQTGNTGNTGNTQPPRSRYSLVLVGGGLAAVIGLVLIGLAGRSVHRAAPVPAPTVTEVKPTPEPTPIPTAAAAPAVPDAKRVRIHIETSPAGARIVRESDGVVLGTTPQDMELPLSSQPLKVRLMLDGYVPMAQAIALDADMRATFALEADKKAERGGKKRPGAPGGAREDEGEPAKM
jgi:eukaryotic-like serine/threonine-protein kinase